MPPTPHHRDPFAELKPPLGGDAALAEANRCLACYDAPCTRACPTHIDVPGFIKKIASGNLAGSARTILASNVLGGSCARVCPTEVLCEGACVYHARGEKPIQIGLLQRHAIDAAMAGTRVVPFERGAKRPGVGRVAIVGAGPAGLACAAELLRLGIDAVVFEASLRPGGLNTVGVAEYKMTPEFALREIKWLIDAGVEIKFGQPVAVGAGALPVADLDRDYAAVFVGVGLGKIGKLGVEGDGLPGVLDALDFIEAVKLDRERARRMAGARMVVVGGGNTSIDVVTQAARLGVAEITLTYRREEGDMPAYAHEVELARACGTRFAFGVQPKRVVGSGKVEGLELDRVKKGPGGLAPTGEVVRVGCDTIVAATGQKPHRTLFEALGLATEGNRVVVDADLRTSRARTWAGGDCITGGKEVVDAVAQGKAAAQSIAAALDPSFKPSYKWSSKEAARG